MKLRKMTALVLVASVFFNSCSSDDDSAQSVPLGDYENGILVVNEGGYGNGNASISYVTDNMVDVENGVYQNVNGTLLGDTAQSLAFYGNLAYIVVNNSQKIEVVNRYTFESVASIDSGLFNPRFITFSNGKGYVTNWGDGFNADDDFIAVIDPINNSVETIIPVQEGPDKLLANGGNLYVSHGGGYNTNNIVSVINTSTNSVITTIFVDDKPDEMITNSQGQLVIMCEGGIQYDQDWNIVGHTQASFITIDTVTNEVIAAIDFPAEKHPSLMTYSAGEIYYYLEGGIYNVNENANELPVSSIINQPLYGDLKVYNDMVLGTNTDFVNGTGELVIFDLGTNSLIDNKELRVGASQIYLN
ncbi:YncE family protein [Mangrovimonas aestuarii]|uniref:YncE family protein n=1 Tax=Mangrovimonas aestuarii TaxID=3018443 RepID=UPI002379AA4A|nr:DUF5074 domain-containing protein [Mangrovimonas aestuarii]